MSLFQPLWLAVCVTRSPRLPLTQPRVVGVLRAAEKSDVSAGVTSQCWRAARGPDVALTGLHTGASSTAELVQLQSLNHVSMYD